MPYIARGTFLKLKSSPQTRDVAGHQHPSMLGTLMNSMRSLLVIRLAQVQDAAALGAAHIGRQQQIITDLTRGGYDTTLAEALLQTYLETQQLYEQDLRRFSDALGVPPQARVLR